MARRFLRFPNFKEKAVTLSYDDGVAQDKRLISIMSKYGLKGTFNINAGLFGSQPTTDKGRMTKEEAYELYTSSGNEVAIHGYLHLSIAEVDSAAAVNDVIEDRKALEKLFGRVIKGMAYPNGSVSDEVVDMLKTCGVQYARTVVSTEKFDVPTDWLRLPATCHHANPKLMELAKEFVEGNESKYFWWKKPRLFYFWGHSYEFDGNTQYNNWGRIEEFCKYIGGREDIWYATNGEIYAYVQAYDRLEFSADGNYVFNPSATDVYLDYYGREVIAKAGALTEIGETRSR
ncbi:MAG: polysaccharide deacetylase family protein [Clostridia bacterium]|nr:polysaccharide deacetylase family protein [Clostridia bacterium]